MYLNIKTQELHRLKRLKVNKKLCNSKRKIDTEGIIHLYSKDKMIN